MHDQRGQWPWLPPSQTGVSTPCRILLCNTLLPGDMQFTRAWHIWLLGILIRIAWPFMGPLQCHVEAPGINHDTAASTP